MPPNPNEVLRGTLLGQIHLGPPCEGAGAGHVHVLGHDYVADEPKSESRPHLIQHFDKAISRPPRAQQWPSAITAKGHEVKFPADFVDRRKLILLVTFAGGSAAEGCAWKKPHP